MKTGLQIISITDLNLPELQPYRTLRRSQEHIRDGLFVAEGERVVLRLLESNFGVASLLLTPQWLKEVQQAFPSERLSKTVAFVGEKRLFEEIVGFNLHQGIMAVGKLPPEESLTLLIRQTSFPRLFVALDGLMNSENVGVVVRNCAAFGVQGILVGETSSSPYLRRAVRNSMGSVFKIPVIHTADLVVALKDLQQNGFEVVGTYLGEHSTSIHATDFTSDVCLVLGNEDSGIRQEVVTGCTNQVCIPMGRGVDSLNVASASAVFLYEIQRQRSRNKKS